MSKTPKSLLVALVAIAAASCEGAPTSEQPTPSQASSSPASSSRAPHANYSLRWIGHNIPGSFQRGVAVPVEIKVQNTGDWPWPDPRTASPGNPSGQYAVRLGYLWLPATGEPIYGPNRADLAAPVAPGETATLTVLVTPPASPGEYRLQPDLVEELVVWFREKGAETLVVPTRVD